MNHSFIQLVAVGILSMLLSTTAFAKSKVGQSPWGPAERAGIHVAPDPVPWVDGGAKSAPMKALGNSPKVFLFCARKGDLMIASG